MVCSCVFYSSLVYPVESTLPQTRSSLVRLRPSSTSSSQSFRRDASFQKAGLESSPKSQLALNCFLGLRGCSLERTRSRVSRLRFIWNPVGIGLRHRVNRGKNLGDNGKDRRRTRICFNALFLSLSQPLCNRPSLERGHDLLR